MIERLEHLGLQELTLQEQRDVLGGGPLARWIGRALGAFVGLVTAILDEGYDNPRYAGEGI